MCVFEEAIITQALCRGHSRFLAGGKQCVMWCICPFYNFLYAIIKNEFRSFGDKRRVHWIRTIKHRSPLHLQVDHEQKGPERPVTARLHRLTPTLHVSWVLFVVNTSFVSALHTRVLQMTQSQKDFSCQLKEKSKYVFNTWNIGAFRHGLFGFLAPLGDCKMCWEVTRS